MQRPCSQAISSPLAVKEGKHDVAGILGDIDKTTRAGGGGGQDAPSRVALTCPCGSISPAPHKGDVDPCAVVVGHLILVG